MLRKILPIFSLASLLVSLIILLFWWRSYSHIDHFGYGSLTTKHTEFTSRAGTVMVTISENIQGQILTRSDFYPYQRIAGACVIIPIFWLAVFIRGKLPRPGGIRRGSPMLPSR